MRDHPEGETRTDRRRQWIVGFGAVIALFSLTGNVVLTASSINQNHNAHVATTKLQNELIQKDTQLIALTQKTATNAKEAAATAQYIAALATDLNTLCLFAKQVAPLTGATALSCKPFPTLP